MKVCVRMFAAARQLAGAPTIDVELPAAATVAQLRAAILERFPNLQPLQHHLLFAVNTQYAHDDTNLGESDEIACIPPVSGG